MKELEISYDLDLKVYVIRDNGVILGIIKSKNLMGSIFDKQDRERKLFESSPKNRRSMGPTPL